MRPVDLVKDSGGLLLYRYGPGVVGALPRSGVVRIAETLGAVLRRAARGDSAWMRDELRRTFGDAITDPDGAVRRAFRLRMMNEFEVLSYPTLGPSTVNDTVELHGREHLDRALAGGRGAIVMIGHFGANQLIMPALGHRGYRMNQLSASPTAWLGIRDDGRVNPLFAKVQERRWGLERHLPAQLIDVFGFLRPAYNCLERNEVLGLAFDGGGGSRWVPTPIGRRTAWTPTQPWQLARTTGAAIVPTVVVREPGDPVHRVVLDEPFTVGQTKDREKDVSDATQRYGRWFTEWVRRYPDHYLPYLLLRRKVWRTDARPFFDDYPEMSTV